MSVSLYDHQKAAVEKLKTGSILVGGVGSGKSRTSLAYYFKTQKGAFEPKYSDMKNPKDLYIITTARKRDTFEWEDELIPFLLSSDPSKNHYKNHVVIDSWNNIQKYVKVTNAFFIFDEQRVVGTGAWVKAFIKIAKTNDWILLSATPGDTWSDYAPVFVANGFYKNLTEFARRHVVYSRFAKYPKIDHYIEIERLIELRKKILVYMAFERPTVSHHETLPAAYDKELYSKVLKERWNIYKDEPCQDASSVCYVLRRIVNSDVTRQWILGDIAEKHDRLIIFYNFNYELDTLREYAKSLGIACAEWNGQKHESIPKTKKWFYLVQYSAGAEGWNCIETNCIVFYSQNYSYKMTTQAAGRIDRMNTPYKDLYYYHIRSAASIDKAINMCLVNKKNFNEKAFIGER